MPIITWGKALSVGFSAIDDDHQKLIALFNAAHGAVKQTSPRQAVETILTELIEYTNWHFDHEEALMEEHGYDRIEAHKLEHQELAANARELYVQYLAGDDTVPEVLLPFLRNWLTDHILRSDKRLGDFLNGYQRQEL
ncbi:MAG: bacteriohemerythrin [Pseudodesulfovibrio sp.]|uniref:bacteriohemerythrin n=1 Tax=Pseudodesulfovibrio sp. TaxID=2035812 RepID=UPI003D0C9E00